MLLFSAERREASTRHGKSSMSLFFAPKRAAGQRAERPETGFA
jgi:hypothetical protein